MTKCPRCDCELTPEQVKKLWSHYGASQPRPGARGKKRPGIGGQPKKGDETMTQRFELVFYGAATVTEYRFPRYRRMHKSMESARETARQVWEKLAEKGLPTACHTPIVHGPGCGKDGIAVVLW